MFIHSLPSIMYIDHNLFEDSDNGCLILKDDKSFPHSIYKKDRFNNIYTPADFKLHNSGYVIRYTRV